MSSKYGLTDQDQETDQRLETLQNEVKNLTDGLKTLASMFETQKRLMNDVLARQDATPAPTLVPPPPPFPAHTTERPKLKPPELFSGDIDQMPADIWVPKMKSYLQNYGLLHTSEGCLHVEQRLIQKQHFGFERTVEVTLMPTTYLTPYFYFVNLQETF
jgi:hypothetical protein